VVVLVTGIRTGGALGALGFSRLATLPFLVNAILLSPELDESTETRIARNVPSGVLLVGL
jgi:hypothetical protein